MEKTESREVDKSKSQTLLLYCSHLSTLIFLAFLTCLRFALFSCFLLFSLLSRFLTFSLVYVSHLSTFLPFLTFLTFLVLRKVLLSSASTFLLYYHSATVCTVLLVCSAFYLYLYFSRFSSVVLTFLLLSLFLPFSSPSVRRRLFKTFSGLTVVANVDAPGPLRVGRLFGGFPVSPTPNQGMAPV